MMINLHGCGTALVTPFHNGEVDYEAFRRLVRRQISGGVDYLLALGTTGETPNLSLEEKIKILNIAEEESGGRPVIVGGGTNSLTQTIHSIKELEPYGPDAFLIVVPYYNKPTQEGLYQYFKAVAESTEKPVILYNVPSRTGTNMLAETTVRLARDVRNVVAIKEASGIFGQVSEILRNAPEDFQVISGDDALTLPFMSAGAVGVISVASNIAPAEVSELVHLAEKGDFIGARAVHHRLSPLFKACFVESNPIPTKAALSCMGLCDNELRLPLVPAAAKTKALVASVLKELGI